MRKCWFALVFAVICSADLLSPAQRFATAQEMVKHSNIALAMESTLDRGFARNSSVEFATHDLCGIGLGGYCPGRYRSCIRAGTPQAQCQVRLERCNACNHAMHDCRQQVGHQPGYTCAQCRQALDKCRAGISAPIK